MSLDKMRSSPKSNESLDKVKADCRSAYEQMRVSLVEDPRIKERAEGDNSDEIFSDEIFRDVYRWIVSNANGGVEEDITDATSPERLRQYFVNGFEGRYDSMSSLIMDRRGISDTSQRNRARVKMLRGIFEPLATIAKRNGFNVDLSKYL